MGGKTNKPNLNYTIIFLTKKSLFPSICNRNKKGIKTMSKIILILTILIGGLLIASCSSSGGGITPTPEPRGQDSFEIELSEDTLTVMQGKEGELNVAVSTNQDLTQGVNFSLKGQNNGVELNSEENGKGSYTLNFKVSEEAAPGTHVLQILATLGKSSAKAKLNLVVSSEFKTEIFVDFFSDRRVEESKEVPGRFIARVIGKGVLSKDGPEDEFDAFKSDEDDGVKVPRESENVLPEKVKLVAFELGSRNEFEVELSTSFMREVHDFQVERGRTRSSLPIKEISEPTLPIKTPIRTPIKIGEDLKLRPQKILGVDTRIRLTATTTHPWRTIAQFDYGDHNSNCSGTFIGRRIIITAAHCINKRGTEIYYTPKITPGRNDIDGTPYGSVQTNARDTIYYTPWHWRESDECTSNQTSCRRWDWGLIVLPANYNNQTGWMGYWYMSGGSLSQKSIYNRGYPACGNSHSPAGCVTAGFYGDTKTCSILSYLHQGNDGWSDFILHNCDTSGGHSGSPLYMYVGNAGPVVTAVHGYGYSTSNGARRLGPNEASIISFFRNALP